MKIALAFQLVLKVVGQRSEKVVACHAFHLVNGYGASLHTAYYFPVRHYETEAACRSGEGGYDYLKEAIGDPYFRFAD